ncbi:hypothetical protein QDZ74_005232 [Pluralibacter gergoviae]|uniref:hypothetical protein n=1 Tax=Pluralibacter gergoviae TaxID=61647 RepID=UPI0025A80632|nr:hypothetical protein [Pluralibacter gergoviae]
MKNVLYSLLLICISFPSYSALEYMGVGTHINNNSKVNEISNAILELNLNTFRDDIKWKDIEVNKGVYSLSKVKSLIALIDLMNKKGIRPIIILGYGNEIYDHGAPPETNEDLTAFGNYVDFVSKKLKGKVAFYEIWNEWTRNTKYKDINLSEKSYLAIVKQSSNIIRRNDSNAKILIGGINVFASQGKYFKGSEKFWLKELISKNIMKYADGISLHAYSIYEPTGRRNPELYFNYLDHAVSSLGYNGKFYITEFGVPSEPYLHGFDSKYIKNYILSYIKAAESRSYLHGLWWYDLKDDGVDLHNREHHFGLLDYHYKMKSYASSIKDK